MAKGDLRVPTRMTLASVADTSDMVGECVFCDVFVCDSEQKEILKEAISVHWECCVCPRGSLPGVFLAGYGVPSGGAVLVG